MTKKKAIFIVLAIAAVVAAIVAVVAMLRSEAPVQEEELYDRMQNPEYKKILEFEKAEQKRTMGKIALAQQNLEEAKESKLEPEIIAELEDAVAAEEKELELERDRMRANLRRELWRERHPEQVKQLDDYRAAEVQIMADIEAAQKRLDAAKAEGATAEETAALKAEVDALVKKLAENHNEAAQAMRKLSNR